MAAKEIDVGSSSIDVGDPCPICLGPILQESYLDTCFRTPLSCPNLVLLVKTYVYGLGMC